MIKYAGVELLLEDLGGDVSKHVQRYLEWPQSLVNPPARTIDSKCRVQRPQWPDAPKLKPNQLYWPTGATRWGQFIGLADTASKDAILAGVGPTISTANLEIGLNSVADVNVVSGVSVDGTFNLSAQITAKMYLLPPVPLSLNEDTLWIIPLVDERYWWQTGIFTSSATTWIGLLEEIEESLGITVNGDVAPSTPPTFDTNYGVPDKCIFRNGAINPAAALDMLCWATNSRLVTQKIGGQYLLRTNTSADALYQAERDALLDNPYSLGSSAGADTPNAARDGDVPTDIVFYFTNDGPTTHLTHGQLIADAPAWAGGTLLEVMCPAVSTGSNDSTLEAMADKWSAEFWDWSRHRFYWSLNGLIRWQFSGYEDYVLVDQARQDGESEAEDGDDEREVYICRTFVKSLPPLSFGYDFVPIQVDGLANSCGASEGCDCCPECCGTLWYVTGDAIAWVADHFAGETAANLALFPAASQALYATSADQDADGNVYQGGHPSALLQTTLSLPQTPMYTLRSYTSDGLLRWSWSPYPYGYDDGFSHRAKPYPVFGVRCGGNDIFVWSIDNSTLPIFYKFNQDGTIIWTKTSSDLDAVCVNAAGKTHHWQLMAASPDYVLITSNDNTGTSWLVIDHSGAYAWDKYEDGVFTADTAWMDFSNSNTWTSDGSGGIQVIDSSGGPVPSPSRTLSGGYIPTKLRVTGSVMLASNGSVINTYPSATSDPVLNSVSTTEVAMMLSTSRTGVKNDNVARIRNLDLTPRLFFNGLVPSDSHAITDAMPTSIGSVWSGKRACGVSLVFEFSSETTTTTGSTTSTTTASTTSTTTISTTSTTTASTTSTTTASTSTTTRPPCTGSGLWTWNGSSWVATSNTCSDGCSPASPDFFFPPGTHIGETTTTSCV